MIILGKKQSNMSNVKLIMNSLKYTGNRATSLKVNLKQLARKSVVLLSVSLSYMLRRCIGRCCGCGDGRGGSGGAPDGTESGC